MGGENATWWNPEDKRWRESHPEEFARLLRERKRREDEGLASGAGAERYWLERIRRRQELESG